MSSQPWGDNFLSTWDVCPGRVEGYNNLLSLPRRDSPRLIKGEGGNSDHPHPTLPHQGGGIFYIVPLL